MNRSTPFRIWTQPPPITSTVPDGAFSGRNAFPDPLEFLAIIVDGLASPDLDLALRCDVHAP